MPQTLAQSFYNGPFAVYTSPTGITDPATGSPGLGGSLHEGDYVDLSLDEANQSNIRFGTKLYSGRYRFVRLSPQANPANIGFGKPAAWARPTNVAQLGLATGGTGATADGTYTITSTPSGGTAAVGLAIVTGGVITAVQMTFAGANFTSVPTFPLTEIAGLTGASVLAQMRVSPNLVTSFDASAQSLSSPRGVFLCSVTQAQITANCYVVIQELGVAPVLVTTATGTAQGVALAATTGAAVTSTNPATAIPIGFMGYSLDVTAAGMISRCDLQLPTRQG